MCIYTYIEINKVYKTMKQLASQFFDDEEYERLSEAKGVMTWKEFILSHPKYMKLIKKEVD